MSLGSLPESHPLAVVTDRISVTEAVDAIVVGGRPTNVGLSTSQALEANVASLDMIVNADVRSVDGVQRDPDGVRRVIASYARSLTTDCSLRAIGRAAEKPLAESDTARLHLGVPPTDDAAPQGLIDSGRLANELELELDGTRVTDVSLAALARLNRLQRLSIRRTQTTPEGVRTLRRTKPACEITADASSNLP